MFNFVEHKIYYKNQWSKLFFGSFLHNIRHFENMINFAFFYFLVKTAKNEVLQQKNDTK